MVKRNMTLRRDFDASTTGNNGYSFVQNRYPALGVNRNKQTIFVQINTTQVHLINLNCFRMYATCFGPSLDHLQE